MAIVNSQTSIDQVDRGSFRADPLALGLIIALALTVVQRLVGLGRNVLFCRLLPDEQLGQWSLVYNFLIFFAPLVILGLPGCFGRYVEHYRQREQLGYFLKRIVCVTVALSLASIIGMSAASEYFSWVIFGNKLQSGIIYLLCISLLVIIWHNFLTELLEALRQIRLVAWMRFIASMAFALASIGCILIRGPYVSSLVIGYTIGFAVAMMPGIIYLVRNGILVNESHSGQVRVWRKVLPYAGWVWLNNALINLFVLTDTYILLHCSSADNEVAQSAVGQYHSGLVIPVLLGSVATLMTGALMPYMAKAWEEGNREESGRLLKSTLKLAAIGLTFGGVLVLILSPILFDWILEGRYNDGLSVLPMAFAYYAWFSLATIALSYLWCAEKGWTTAVTYGIGLVVNVVLNLLLIPHYGIYGAVGATMTANALALLLIYYFAWRNELKIDASIFLVSLLPLILLTNVLLATSVLLCLLALLINGNRILDVSEKKYALQLGASLKAKIGI